MDKEEKIIIIFNNEWVTKNKDVLCIEQITYQLISLKIEMFI